MYNFPAHFRQRCVEDIAALFVRDLSLLTLLRLAVLCSTGNVLIAFIILAATTRE